MINLGKHFEKTEVTKEQLQAINELLGIKESKVWKPEFDEEYYFMTAHGHIRLNKWDKHIIDDQRFNLGNVFKTKEEAEFARDKQIFLTKMKRDFIENSDKIDWKDQTQTKYYLYYEHFIELVQISNRQTSQHGLVFYTTNYKWLEQYARENEKDIIKYYLGVKENENEF